MDELDEKKRRFEKTVYETMQDKFGVNQGARILVAVSGGSDSVALLCALRNLSF